MPAYLITGRSGSGKSTIAKGFQARGLPCIDSDKVPGLVRWEDIATGEAISVDPTGYVDYDKVGWNWSEQSLVKLLGEHPLLFLCGSASNQISFHNLFTKVFVLTLRPETQTQRILDRPHNPYGKHPEMLAEILADQKEFVVQAQRLGAISIDAEQSVDVIIEEILKQSVIDQNNAN